MMIAAMGRNYDWVPEACLWILVALLVTVLGIGIYNTIEPDKDVHGVPCTISEEC